MRPTRLLVVLGILMAVAYLATSSRTGFIAHDEGLLGQSATRVLSGEAPHVDFDDPYTGGLTYLNALSFRALGSRSSSLRVVLLGFATVFLVCLYLIARRLVSPLAATAVAMGAAAWSLKNYFAGLPSWYNLFFAVFGILALLMDMERDMERDGEPSDSRTLSAPLIVAGLMGGLSVLVKITGLFFIAAGLLYVLFDAQRGAPARARRLALADLCAWLALPVTLVLLLGLLAARLEAMDVVHFLLPAALVAGLPWLFLRSRSAARGQAAQGQELQRQAPEEPASDRRFLGRSAQFLLGAALPPTIFVGALVAEHGTTALASLYRGVFELPRLRFGSAEFSLPPLSSLIVAAPFLVLCVPAVQRRLRGRWPLVLVGSGLATLLVLARSSQAVYQAVWAPLRSLTPFFVFLAVFELIRSRRLPPSHARPDVRRTYLLVAMAAFLSLGQFPYSSGLYFAYTAPVLALLIVDVWSRHRDGRRVQLMLAAFAVLFAVLYVNGTDPRSLGYRYQPLDRLELLAPERVNLKVPPVQRRGYEAIIELVRNETSPTDGIWAGPDAPEIYFFTGKPNRTRHIYEFVDPEWEAKVLELTAGPEIRLVVINRRPEFTGPMSAATSALLARRFPLAAQIGPMEVRWRSAGGQVAFK